MPLRRLFRTLVVLSPVLVALGVAYHYFAQPQISGVWSTAQNAVQAQLLDDGRLEIYDGTTPLGTIARKVYMDPQNRIAKQIYYTENSRKWRPNPRKWRALPWIAESGLVVHTIRYYEYEIQGYARIETATRGHSGYVRSFYREGNEPFSRIYYDLSGAKVVGISGGKPDGVDLTEGWGVETNGIACGISVSKPTGSTAGRSACITVSNKTDSIAHVIELDLEIKDADGKVVQGKKVASNRLKLENGNIMTIDQREVQPTSYYYTDQNLFGWYGDLPRGRYKLTAKFLVNGFEVRSQTVDLALTERWNYKLGKAYDTE